jgi:hypothetical protein
VTSKLLERFSIGRLALAALLSACLGLAGCNTGSGVADSLTPTAEMRSQAGAAPLPAATVGSETALAADQPPRQGGIDVAVRQQQQAALSPAATPPVAFMPVTGAPQSAVTQLAQAMRGAARAEAVPVVVSLDQGARFQIRGYLSAINDGGGVTLHYVWDVLDAEGARVHRISGQERGGASANDPWSGVSGDMMDRVARSTMYNLRLWMSGRSAG